MISKRLNWLVALAVCLVLSVPVYAGVKMVSKTVTAQNQFTDGVVVKDYGTVAVSGSFTATVTLQTYINGGWLDTGDSWTEPGVYTFTDHGVNTYRAGVKTGGFTSASTLYIELKGKGEGE